MRAPASHVTLGIKILPLLAANPRPTTARSRAGESATRKDPAMDFAATSTTTKMDADLYFKRD
jgi:hypothetical protein